MSGSGRSAGPTLLPASNSDHSEWGRQWRGGGVDVSSQVSSGNVRGNGALHWLGHWATSPCNYRDWDSALRIRWAP